MNYLHSVIAVIPASDEKMRNYHELADMHCESMGKNGWELVAVTSPTPVTPMLLFFKSPSTFKTPSTEPRVDLKVKSNPDGTISFDRDALANASVADLEHDLAVARSRSELAEPKTKLNPDGTVSDTLL